jgi:hypothetical protein
MYVSAVIVILNRYIKCKNTKIMQYFLIVMITLVNGKRTFTMMLIGVLIIIGYTQELNGTIRKTVFVAFVAGVYFIIYGYVTGKVNYNPSWYSTISEYFFRAEHTRLAIFSCLHPDAVRILSYPGQTILYDLFYYIPRTLWIDKPYPYPIYYFAAVMQLGEIVNSDWRFQTSCWPELISNFGIIGFGVGCIIMKKMAEYYDDQDHIIKILGITLLCLLQIYEYSDLLKIIVIIELLLIIKRKIFI